MSSESNSEPAQRVTSYRPYQRHELGYIRVWATLLRNLRQSKDLILILLRRDFVAQYKKSFVGYGWVLISPLTGIVSWVFMEMTGILNAGGTDVPYPAYVMAGTTMWGLFMGFYGAASRTLGAGSGLLMQVSYPHDVLLFKTTAQHAIGFIITLGVTMLVLLIFRVVPSWGTLLLPLMALPMFFLGASLGLMVCMIRIVAFDINRIISMGMGFLMFTTPIVYSNRVENQFLQMVIKWNPLTYMVCSARDMMLFGRLYENNWQAYAGAAGASLILFLIVWRLFYVSENKLIERMV